MTKKKATVSERYWEKRRELEDKARLKLEKKTLSELESVFERALVKIQRQGTQAGGVGEEEAGS